MAQAAIIRPDRSTRRRAERKAGKLYDAQEKAKGGRLPPHGAGGSQTLEQLGISSQDMSKWRKMAKVPDRQFDAAFAKGGKPSIH